MLFSSQLFAEQPLPCKAKNPDDKRPRIGLVLGGGGARGVAHISVIKELERLHVPIDCIAGTSMGSLIGGLYASGMSSDELEQMVTTLEWKTIMSDNVPRQERSLRRKSDDHLSLAPIRPGVGKDGLKLPSGVLSGENIIMFLTHKTSGGVGITDFNKLSIPYRAVATDINSGQAVVLASGSLPMAMRASMSIPGAFTPVAIDGHLLVDGGMVDQVPVDVARAMGADIVIAVDVGTPLTKINNESNVLKIADQVIGFLTVGNTDKTIASLRKSDILIQPKLGDDVSTTSFEPDKILLALEIGKQAASNATAKLAALSAPTVLPRQVPVEAATQATVAFIDINNKSLYDNSIFEEVLKPLKDKPLDYTQTEKVLKTLYGQYQLDLVTYEVVHRDNKVGLAINVEPMQTGRLKGEFGLKLASNQNSQTQFDLTFGVLLAPFNAPGGEIRALMTIGDEPRSGARE